MDKQGNGTESPVLTVYELAAYLRLDRSTAYNLVRSKDFPAFKIGREWRIVKSEVDAWLIRRGQR